LLADNGELNQSPDRASYFLPLQARLPPKARIFYRYQMPMVAEQD